MRLKAFFIMAIILLAARFGAAQETYVVYEGAETTHSVVQNPGNEYLWEVYKNFNPDVPAEPTEFYFVGTDNANAATIHWIQAGFYFLKVTETDAEGCTNVKALAISVLPNDRSIGFENASSGICAGETDNGFILALEVLDSEGNDLEATEFPIDVRFTVNNVAYSQSVAAENRQLLISDEMFTHTPGTNTKVLVEITQATDKDGSGISPSEKKLHTRTLFAIPVIEFINVPDTIDLNTFYAFEASGEASYTYSWWFVDENEQRTDFTSATNKTEEYFWDVPGTFTLLARAKDTSDCLSETISESFTVVDTDYIWIVDAGSDTLIGSCEPYVINASVTPELGMSYAWEPADLLDDPGKLNPVFTPGTSTSFILTATNSLGGTISDTVEIDVSEIYADAGEDFVIEAGSQAMLDASGSFGAQLQYLWTTTNGTIVSGADGPNPLISSAGTYMLQVSDSFNCVATDSVVVSLLRFAPIVRDDYDTTTFQTPVDIAVLENDEDPDGDLDPSSLQIIQFPVNGTVSVNYDDYTVTYTPDNGFVGGDVFEYTVCDLTDLCGNAHVYVRVTSVDFLIPEAFTPNGDNINDFFEIQGIELYPNNKLSIVNRWGKAVYEAHAYGINTDPKFWDGTWQKGDGKELPTGTYFYVLDLGTGEQPIAGSVYIDR